MCHFSLAAGRKVLHHFPFRQHIMTTMTDATSSILEHYGAEDSLIELCVLLQQRVTIRLVRRSKC